MEWKIVPGKKKIFGCKTAKYCFNRNPATSYKNAASNFSITLKNIKSEMLTAFHCV